jgi:hypothetical protein
MYANIKNPACLLDALGGDAYTAVKLIETG